MSAATDNIELRRQLAEAQQARLNLQRELERVTLRGVGPCGNCTWPGEIKELREELGNIRVDIQNLYQAVLGRTKNSSDAPPPLGANEIELAYAKARMRGPWLAIASIVLSSITLVCVAWVAVRYVTPQAHSAPAASR